jgi:copper homeostasis protein (lipoprotein)
VRRDGSSRMTRGAVFARCARTIVLSALALAGPGCTRPEPVVVGKATYSGPALPSTATFEVTLVEAPHGDSGGRLIGSALVGGAGPSPIAFRIPYDPGQVREGREYVVHARIIAERSVLYLGERGTPVLTQGRGREATIELVRVDPTRQLPASFTGKLPCADCAKRVLQVDLLPDSVFYLREIRRNERDSIVRYDIGRWALDSTRTRLTLHGTRDETFAALGASVLRLTGVEESPGSERKADLLRTSAATPLEPKLTLRGMYRTESGAGTFADCRTNRPIAIAKGQPALDAAIRRAGGRPETPILLRLEARIVRSDSARASALSVTHVLGAARTEGC